MPADFDAPISAQNRSAESGIDSPGDELLDVAARAYRASTNWMDSNLRPQWERNLRAFQGRHPTGSKYFSSEYQHRSKLFRPKTRSAVRNAEASAASAFFATENVASCNPADDNDPQQLASARINQALLQYRLTRSIPWYQLVIAARQSCDVYGFCVSKQSWLYREVEDGTEEVPQLDEATGMPMFDGGHISLPNGQVFPLGPPLMKTVPRWRVTEDRPDIQLIPPENVRLDPGADWRDPIQSSPYLIILLPMFVCDVKMLTKQPEGGKTGVTWLPVNDAQLQQAKETTPDSTRQVREQSRDATADGDTGVSDFDIVWVRENFLRRDGKDVHFMSLSDVTRLSEPKPIREVYQQDDRPYAMGFGQVEAYRVYPMAKVEMMQDLQREANEVANTRLDNVLLAMSARHYVRAGRGVDIPALKKVVPGGIVLMRDPNNDVRTERAPDVTQSAYAEQDRLNVDIDEVAGSFSPSSVQTNRQLNETVGGMQLMAGQASGLVEFDLRTFAETWAEPTLQQVIRLEQMFESDPVVLAIAGQQAELYQRFGINTITDDLLLQDVTVSVNVGIGATNPQQRMQKLDAAMGMTAKLLGPELAKHLNLEEVIAEVFGAAGYKDGKRFINLGDDPKYAALMSQIEDMGNAIQQLQDDRQAQMALEDKRSQTQLALKQMDMQLQPQLVALSTQGKAAMQQQEMLGKSVLQRQQIWGKSALQQQTQAHDLTMQGVEAEATRQEQATNLALSMREQEAEHLMALRKQDHEMALDTQGQAHDQMLAREQQAHEQGLAVQQQMHDRGMAAQQHAVQIHQAREQRDGDMQQSREERMATLIGQAVGAHIKQAQANGGGGGGGSPVVLDSHTKQIKDLGSMQAGWEQTAQALQDGVEKMFERISGVLQEFADAQERQRLEQEADSNDIRQRLVEIVDEIEQQRADTESMTQQTLARQQTLAHALATPRDRRIANIRRDEQGRLAGADLIDRTGNVVAQANLTRGAGGQVTGGGVTEEQP